MARRSSKRATARRRSKQTRSPTKQLVQSKSFKSESCFWREVSMTLLLAMVLICASLVALHVISSSAPPVHLTAAHVQTAGEKPTTYVDERGIDNTAVAVLLSTDGLLTGSCPWSVAPAVSLYKPSRPILRLWESESSVVRLSGNNVDAKLALVLQPVGRQAPWSSTSMVVTINVSNQGLLANNGLNTKNGLENIDGLLARPFEYMGSHSQYPRPVSHDKTIGLICHTCLFMAAMLLILRDHLCLVELQQRIEALECRCNANIPAKATQGLTQSEASPTSHTASFSPTTLLNHYIVEASIGVAWPMLGAAWGFLKIAVKNAMLYEGTPRSVPAPYCHTYRSLEHEQQLAERDNKRGEAIETLGDGMISLPYLRCRGAFLEVSETSRRRFPDLHIPPPTNPSLVRSPIKLSHMATEIGIDVPGYGLVTVMNARDIMLAIEDMHGEPGVSNRDLDVQLIRAAQVVWMVGNLVSWAHLKPDLNMDSCSGTFPPTPADLRRYTRHVSRKGLGEEEEEFRSVLEDLMLDSKQGQWRSTLQEGADGDATMAECCYLCNNLWDGDEACGADSGYPPCTEYILIHCDACAATRGRCGEFAVCMVCARDHLKKRVCPHYSECSKTCHISSSGRVVPQNFLRDAAFV